MAFWYQDRGILDLADRHRAGLAVAKQPLRVREVRTERERLGPVIERGLDRGDFAGVSKLRAVGKGESPRLSSPSAVPARPCWR